MQQEKISDVEVIIACHNPDRPVERAVTSVLTDNPGAKVSVVCHNIPAAHVQQKLSAAQLEKVQLLEFSDGVHSPSGPFMYGIKQSRAKWVAIMGSDDVLEPGHLQAMLRYAPAMDAVMARIVRVGQTVATPRFRFWKNKNLHPVKDRLFYRSAPLGIMRRDFINAQHLTLTPGLTAGGDLDFSQQLWRTGRIAVQRSGPAYKILEDATDRVTMRLAKAADELQHCHYVWELNPPTQKAQREALAIKYLRNHLIGFATLRAKHDAWQLGDRELLAQWISTLLHEAPLAARVLARADYQLVKLLADPQTSTAEITDAVRNRERKFTAATLLPQNLLYVLHREAPIRLLMAAVTVTLWGKR